jgi:hypothetical protein
VTFNPVESKKPKVIGKGSPRKSAPLEAKE